MWKKDEAQPTQHPSTAGTGTQAVAPKSTQGGGGGGLATIGPSISIKGDVTGSEDLLIHGRIDGSVSLDQHAVGVGREGRVKANIVGRVITIDGHVEGDLIATEQIVLRGSAQVHGDIKAPRVILEDGATFRGLVDMGASATSRSDAGQAGKSAAQDPAVPAHAGRAAKGDGNAVAQATG